MTDHTDQKHVSAFQIADALATSSPEDMQSEELAAHVALHVSILEDLKARYDAQYKESQEILRVYVTEKSLPLKERFKVWKKWCKKVEHGFVINEVDVPLFGKMVADSSGDFDRYVDYDWDHFLDRFKGEWGDDPLKKYGVTMDDVKEALIETNFGSFTMDW